MGLLKKTKSLWQMKKTSTLQVGAPLAPLNEEVDTPPLPSTEQRPSRQIPQRTPDPARLVTAENIRELRERIRYRYSLDVEILKQRNVKPYMRGNLEENMRKSVAVLADIREMVQGWDRREFFATDLEYEKFQVIKRRLLEGNKINWEKIKPWELDLRNMVPLRAPYEMSDRTESTAQRPAPSSFGSRRPPRERPDDVPFARQNQRPERVSDRNPSQRSRLAMDPARQTQLGTTAPQQIQHGLGPLQQEQRNAHSSRQAPYTTNPGPPMRYPEDPVRRSQRAEGPPQQDMYALVSPPQSDLSLLSQRSELGIRSPPPSELAPGSPPATRYAPYAPPDAYRTQSYTQNPQSAAQYGNVPYSQPGGVVAAPPRQIEGLRLSRQRDSRSVSLPMPHIRLTAPTPPVGRRVLSDPSHIEDSGDRSIRIDSPVPRGRVEGPPSSQHSAPGY
ncbi:hypothetical protein J4E83_001865 [Alternaria metachromatica]|uniref:uncharacterized protein n=1 Tax=Alternaria metachromatica TaxID=283354 RepID=UPI0020C4826B|nr:uncharacterized protein J4E83_001865 [Alternaria metachromatica]KAI4634546.1 hypothetical protein J4E83_001865 [Alternaria metachromatica]